MRRALPFAALFLGLSSAAAFAQVQTSNGVSDRQATTFNEIERGFYFGLAAGANFISKPPASGTSAQPSTLGEIIELELGGDIGSHFAVSAFCRASFQREDASYQGQSAGGTVAGDFTMIVPGVSVRFKPIGFQDSQQVERTWFYLRGGVGYTFFSPKDLLPNSDILVFAGPGIEYYTRLRHFSIGVEAVGSWLAKAGSFGFAVTPNLRYAF